MPPKDDAASANRAQALLTLLEQRGVPVSDVLGVARTGGIMMMCAWTDHPDVNQTRAAYLRDREQLANLSPPDSPTFVRHVALANEHHTLLRAAWGVVAEALGTDESDPIAAEVYFRDLDLLETERLLNGVLP